MSNLFEVAFKRLNYAPRAVDAPSWPFIRKTSSAPEHVGEIPEDTASVALNVTNPRAKGCTTERKHFY